MHILSTLAPAVVLSPISSFVVAILKRGNTDLYCDGRLDISDLPVHIVRGVSSHLDSQNPITI